MTDANGIVVHKEGKNGKAVPKKVRVNSITGETKIVFSIHHARKEFQKHFGIEFKPTGYVPKEKKEEEKVVDPFLAMIAKFEKEDNKEENKETKKKK